MSTDSCGLGSPAYLDDPYPLYRRLRDEAPVHFCEPWGGWVIARHDDVMAAFRDPRWSSDRAKSYPGRADAAMLEQIAPLLRNLQSWTLLMDPPAHTRVRALLNRAFTPKLMAALGPRIAAVVGRLLDELDGRAGFDLVEALATPLPVMVIGEMLGLPLDDRHHLKRWSDDLAAFLGASKPTPERIQAAVRAVGELEAYFRAQLAPRRAQPREDLLSALLQAEEAGSILDENELLATCASILFGGHETTTNLIANGVNALLRHEREWRRLAAEPELVSNAVEELLRFDAPVQRMGRVAKEPIELRGCRVEPGQRAFLLIGSANRDPACCSTPDRLDVGRAAGKHMSFGWGPHYCVGAALGRLEAEAAIGALARRFPSLRLLDDRPPRIDNQTIRGFTSLRLATA